MVSQENVICKLSVQPAYVGFWGYNFKITATIQFLYKLFAGGNNLNGSHVP